MAYSGLKDLLINPNAYRIGTTGQNAASKGIDYPEGQGPLLGRRVEWNIIDENSEPTFLGIGVDHGKPGSEIDSFVRGGPSTALNRRLMDAERIGKFFLTPAGIQFLATQTTLQALNPRPQKFYNFGLNTLASVAAAGVSNIRRGGLLPTVGGFNILGKDTGTYIGDVGGGGRKSLREAKYGLGDPGIPISGGILKKLTGISSPLEYNVSTGVIDKVNALRIFESGNSIPDLNEQESKDFVPFRFEVINPNGTDRPSNIIVFRAYLDSISDDYNATHNSYKYNGRGEEFYTYNKFNRKIAVSFKIAAQSRFEMKPIYQKLNYLAAQTAPNYSSTGRIRTPYCKLTIGHWFNKIPGLITSVSLSWQKDYPWEIALDREFIREFNEEKDINIVTDIKGKDRDMLILPHVLDVSLNFQPIHDFTPSNDIMAPFIGINGDSVFNDFRKEILNKVENEIIGDTEDATALYQPSFTDDQGDAIGESDLPGNPLS